MEKRFLKRSHTTPALHKSRLTTAQYIALFNYFQKNIILTYYKIYPYLSNKSIIALQEISQAGKFKSMLIPDDSYQS